MINMALTDSTLISDGVTNVQAYLADSTYVADPNLRGTQWVFTSFPKKGFNFPIIVITPPQITGTSYGFTGATRKYSMTFTVHIYSANAKQVDTVGDEVLYALTTADGVINFKQNYGMMFESVNILPQRKIEYGLKNIYEKKINFRYMYWGA